MPVTVALSSDGAPTTAAAGEYPIAADVTQTAGNYAVTVVPGVFTVTKVSLTITAKPATKEYGEEKTFAGTPEEFEVAGELKNGDLVTAVAIAGEKAAATATEVGEYPEDIVPGFPIEGINTNNYDIVFSNATLTVTQAVLTVTVNDATWRIGKPRPAFSFADFTPQLKGGDTIADVTGGSGIATDVDYTNVVWNASEPATESDAGEYPDEIWIDIASLDGGRAPIIRSTSLIIPRLYQFSSSECMNKGFARFN